MSECIICNKKEKFSKTFEYFKPPVGETKFNIRQDKYSRFYVRCNFCRHWSSVMKINIKNLYNHEYNSATYKGKLKKNFKKLKIYLIKNLIIFIEFKE